MAVTMREEFVLESSHAAWTQTIMQPNRMGLGLRPPYPSFGQGPPLSALAQQQSMHFVPPQAQKQTKLFVGSISGGVTDTFLNELLSVRSLLLSSLHYIYHPIQACGKVTSFKRLITPANKPQGFGFAEYDEPESAIRAINLLTGVELPALEDGCANKSLLVCTFFYYGKNSSPKSPLHVQVKPDEKTKAFLDAYSSQRMVTNVCHNMQL